MSTVLHLPVLNTQHPYMREKSTLDTLAPAFTAVNGRISPPSPPRSSSMNGNGLRQSPPHAAVQPLSEHPEFRPVSHSHSPQTFSEHSSPESPNKRRRSVSLEELANLNGHMDPVSQQRSLPPLVDRSNDLERRWTAELQQHNAYHTNPESRHLDPINPNLPPPSTIPPHAVENGWEPPRQTETTRAGVQVEMKKRKRQFANRTKTGCGTCRRRKKKCDEAKPECNNCSRGGFVCEGYASKVAWPKPGLTKPPPPLQAKEHEAYSRCGVCSQVHVPHCDQPRGSSQTFLGEMQTARPADGSRTRPLTMDESERQPPAPTTWTGNGWSEPPRGTFAEAPPAIAAQYPPPPAMNHERTPSHEHRLPQPQPSTSARPHHPRPFLHSVPSVGQKVAHSPAGVAEMQAQPPPPPSRQSTMSLSTAAPPAAPQPPYVPQSRAPRTEKDKMLSGEPFKPYDQALAEERWHCTGAVFMYNSLANPNVVITRDERERNFRRIIAAGWIHPRDLHPRQGGHCGGNVNVNIPFHCDYGYNLSIAENVTIGSNSQLLDSARIAIGRNTRIGSRVTISTLKTPSEHKSLKGTTGTELAQEVLIGENVYIGDGAIIEAGVRIGNNAIIRAGSVVVRDIGPDVIAHGNPAYG